MATGRKKPQQIIVLAAPSFEALAGMGADVVRVQFSSLSEAHWWAKQYLTAAYQTASGSPYLGYSQVLVNGNCVADYANEGKGF